MEGDPIDTGTGRIRTLSEKGKELFDAENARLRRQVDTSAQLLGHSIGELEAVFPKSVLGLEGREKSLKSAFDRFQDNTNQYYDFLARQSNTQGIEALESFKARHDSDLRTLESKTCELFDKIEQAKQEAECRSSGAKSESSVRSDTTLKKRAEAEGAKVKLSYLKQETELKHQLERLQQEKDVAVKEAEANFMESKSQVRVLLPKEEEYPEDRTKQYVSTLQMPPFQEVTDPLSNTEKAIAQHLARKDMIKDRLQAFTGKHEHYQSWKQTFKSVVKEYQASEAEEVDLLIRWAGPASRQLISIKASNAADSKLGLERAWSRLDLLYGAPEKVEAALRKKLESVPKISHKDIIKLYDLSDVLGEIRAVKENPKYSPSFAYLDTATGVNPVVTKLPIGVQNKWRERASKYKREHDVLFPPFTFFCDFISDMALTFNDPSFDFVNQNSYSTELPNKPPRKVSVVKTSVDNEPIPCIIHNSNHTLNECRTFRHKTFEERKGLLKKNGVCFKCCLGKHLCRNCHANVKCNECHGDHATAMHIYSSFSPRYSHGGESSSQPQVVSNCINVCVGSPGKSCAKIVLVNIRDKNSDLPPIKVYALIDDQSNGSLARSYLFDHFNISSAPEPYSLRSCGGQSTLRGRGYRDFAVESLDGSQVIHLPEVTECDMIPNNRNEIATPEVAYNHPHLANIAHLIPPLDPDAEILILIGRDAIPAHHVLEQKLGDTSEPFAQKLRLGWVVIGECCSDGRHIPKTVDCLKTYVHYNGRPSILEPCENALESERLFETTANDNRIGLSVEDKQFNELMAKEMKRVESGNWEAPLPFKPNRPTLPNNRSYALKRTATFVNSLHNDLPKRQHTLQFMQDLFDNGHAERAPDVDNEEVWYLPLFGVYHAKKKDSIRIVFDSSATFGGLSLNSVLMSGPNLTNNLLGVLLRFRDGSVAVVADIQQMFYSFLVRPDHRNYLRFVWPENNDLSRRMVDYRMKVHVFGNKPSPAVATYGLNQTAKVAESVYGPDVPKFVSRNFYVDDGLSAQDSATKATDLLKRTQSALKEYGNLRLHKICSNSPEVLASFDKEDLAKDLKNLEFDCDFPLQRSLGVCWNVHDDTFTFNVTQVQESVTRRSVLSTINGLYDPLGLVAAFTITGKLILRDALTYHLGWDEILPTEILEKWNIWVNSLVDLQDIQVPRAYTKVSSDCVDQQDLYVYSDASEKAVAAVAYLVTSDVNGNTNTSFVLGKAKVAPKHGHTIPRLELCAAVLAVEIYETCRDELELNFGQVKFFTDSKVVLGYINNQTKRFLVYVGNRIDRIRNSTSPNQWNYVPSTLNPADDATRGVSAKDLPHSKWMTGPLLMQNNSVTQHGESFPLVLPEEDKELRPLKTQVQPPSSFGCHRFERFSTWDSVVRGVATLKAKIRSRATGGAVGSDVQLREDAKSFIIRTVQREVYPEEIRNLEQDRNIPKDSNIRDLSPFLDNEGLLRVGGRLKNAGLDKGLCNPIIIPKHHISLLLIRHYHNKSQHQGRHITEGAVRNAGLWIIGLKRQVSSYIYDCVTCRKSRGKLENQRMSDLPADRLEPTPPFTNVGLDVFGPWQVTTRKTRGGQANSKRWALLITCLVTRAVHIELLEEMTSSSFINALRRFCAIRGEVRIIRSDCGTNFVGAVGDLRANVINVQDRPVKNYLIDSGINWIFNPPHSSHMGGVWERLIGVARRILDNMLSEVCNLTHETLQTLMSEVSAIINARPLTAVPTDPDVPFPLTPATLLTLKTSQAVKSFTVGDFCGKDLYKDQWRRVQYLSDMFWSRWKNEYLHTLQNRTKWWDKKRNLMAGDVVLLRDKALHRNDWSLGVIVNVHERSDGCVRSVDIRSAKDNKVFSRPVNEIVVLLSE